MVKTPAILHKIFHNLIWKIDTEEKELFLTFDDGPVPQTTPLVLECLNQFNAKATFFCVGDNVRKYPEFHLQIINNGHSTGNHTFNHLVGWKTDTESYLKNIEIAASQINSILFRPPHGKITLQQKTAVQKNYTIVMWHILSKDYKANVSPKTCLENVIKNAEKGSIIVMHDSVKASKNMLYALPRILEHFSKQGFKFKKLESENR